DPELVEQFTCVLTEERPGPLEPQRCSRETHWRSRRAHLTERRVLELAHDAARADVLVVQHLVERVEHAAGDAGLLEQAVPMLAGVRRRHLLDARDELLVVLAAQRTGRKALVVAEVLDPQSGGEGLPVPRRRRADRDVAVGRPYRLVRRVDAVRAAQR